MFAKINEQSMTEGMEKLTRLAILASQPNYKYNVRIKKGLNLTTNKKIFLILKHIL